MFLQHISTTLDFLYDSLKQARMAQRTYEELSSLTDRDLAELGLTRSEIVHVAFQQMKK